MDERVGELIFPSFFYPPSEDDVVKTLAYMPSLNFCLFINNYSSSQIQILDLTSRSPVGNLAFEDRDYSFAFEDRDCSSVIALSCDGHFLASDVEDVHPLPNQIRLSRLSSDGKDLKPDSCVNSCCIEPDLGSDTITSITFSPDGENIFVTTYQDRRMRRGAWLTMYDVPDNFWSNETDKEQEIEESGTDDNNDSDTEAGDTEDTDEEIPKTRNNVTFDVYHLNVLEQGYSIPPSPPESSFDETNLFIHKSGFYCLAISPDTTRLLTGNHDGEVFVIDEDSFVVLQHIQAHGKDTVVSGCHYNPVFAHDEFATCGGDKGNSMLNIWRVEHFENDTEKASCVHSLSLESNPAKCCYSPDGKLVAVTCDSLFTYIVCSRSGVVLYTLAHVDEQARPMPGIPFSVTLFAGRTCQVLTTPNHNNHSIAIWNLPVVYSLETLCLLVLRATIKYGNIDALCLPTSLKLSLKYLYV